MYAKLDLEYGLPIQVGDNAFSIKDDIPRSDINKEYYIQNVDRDMGKLNMHTPGESVGKSQGASDLLMKLARTNPYYKRNRPHIYSFWVKENVNEERNVLFDMKNQQIQIILADQNIKDRYYGINDPVAEKLMKRASALPKLEPPEEKTITTLYL